MKERWVKALAHAVRVEAGRVHAVTNHSFELGAEAFLEAARQDGYELKPKIPTEDMKAAGDAAGRGGWRARR